MVLSVVGAICCSAAGIANEQQNQMSHFTALGAFNRDDTRHLYEVEIIRLILEKTKASYGPYTLRQAPGMTHSQALEAMAQNKTYPNFIRSYGYSPSMPEKYGLELIAFPIWRGLLGYRTCFLSEEIEQRFAAVTTLDELRTFTHGQGTGWVDVTILRHNGFNVTEVPAYTSLFKMAAKNRFDVFCRATSEVREEYNKFSHIPGLSYDRSKVFYYPFPHFLFINKNNTTAIERIRDGVAIITADGSFEQAWQRFHKRNIEFVALEKRQLFMLENPLMSTFNEPYEHYIYRPGE